MMLYSLVMKHFYSDIDGVVLTFGDIEIADGIETLPVYFERDDGKGDFDFAEGSIPEFCFPRSRGFSEYELEQFRQFLKNNTYLLFKAAHAGGSL